MLPMSTTVFRLTPPASFLFSNKLRKVLVALWRFVHHSWCSTNHKQFCGGRRPLFITALTSSATTVYVTSSATTAVLQQLLPLLNPLLRKYNVNTICLLLIVWWFHLYYTRTGHSPPLPIAVHSCLGFCREKSSPFPSLIPSPLPQSSPLGAVHCFVSSANKFHNILPIAPSTRVDSHPTAFVGCFTPASGIWSRVLPVCTKTRILRFALCP